jgi:hypothetical protein
MRPTPVTEEDIAAAGKEYATPHLGHASLANQRERYGCGWKSVARSSGTRRGTGIDQLQVVLLGVAALSIIALFAVDLYG